MNPVLSCKKTLIHLGWPKCRGEYDGAPLKLIDMGLAVRMKGRTRLQDVVGTVLTMAPEVRSKDYDERVDVWGVGMCLYMSAVCMDPWFNPADFSPMEEDQILEALDDPNLKLNYHEKRWNLKPQDVRDLVETLLAVDPTQRPSAKQVMSTNKWLQRNGTTVEKWHFFLFGFPVARIRFVLQIFNCIQLLLKTSNASLSNKSFSAMSFINFVAA